MLGHARLLILLLAVPAAAQQPAAELPRMSWEESCAAIRTHLAGALDRNQDIDEATRTAIEDQLAAAAEAEGDRTACLEHAKEAYDRLAAAYGRTAPSANVLGGATAAPDEPGAVDPERLQGPRTGEVIGDEVEVAD